MQTARIAILHAMWTKVGIVCNDAIAFLEVSMLLVIIVIGFSCHTKSVIVDKS